MRVTFEGATPAVVIPLHACGFAYANAGCKLHCTATRCGVPRICDFFVPKAQANDPLWFPVTDGLSSIVGLRAELLERPESVCDAESSLRDLAELERVLRATPSTRFRLHVLTRAEQAVEHSKAPEQDLERAKPS